ncbi:MAG: TraR/DksA family transcriptional regulator [Candidatus Omnitrophica bacterium]|nr:TraR/DksA family transcriptional regulator [Candidatus Omnitrophota bacterium]
MGGYISSVDINAIEKMLRARHKELRCEIGTHAEYLKESAAQSDDVYGVRENIDSIEAADGMEESEIQLIEEALARIASGKYGYCIDCGEEVGLERLKAIPHAKMCVKCEERREHSV